MSAIHLLFPAALGRRPGLDLASLPVARDADFGTAGDYTDCDRPVLDGARALPVRLRGACEHGGYTRPDLRGPEKPGRWGRTTGSVANVPRLA